MVKANLVLLLAKLVMQKLAINQSNMSRFVSDENDSNVFYGIILNFRRFLPQAHQHNRGQRKEPEVLNWTLILKNNPWISLLFL